MNTARLSFTAVILGALTCLPLVALAGDRGARAASGSDASFRTTSPTQASGFTAMKTENGKTIFVSSKELFSGQDIAGIRTINGSRTESLELSLPTGASDRLTNAIRSGNSPQLAIVRGKKLLAVVNVDLESGAQPRLVGLPVGGANRVTRLIKRAPAILSVANVAVVPRQTRGRAGDLFTVDLYVSGVSNIDTFQFKMRVSGGTSGKLERAGGVIDEQRSDYLFSGKKAIAVVDEMRGRFGGTSMQGAVEAQTPKYVGSYSFRASADASGEFSIGIERGVDSFVSTPRTSEIPFRATGATISVSR